MDRILNQDLLTLLMSLIFITFYSMLLKVFFFFASLTLSVFTFCDKSSAGLNAQMSIFKSKAGKP